ncbi:MAG: hypothetical protein ACLS3C_14865 [Oscillospiraceae bacterium]
MGKGRSRRASGILLLQSRPVSQTAALTVRPPTAQLLLQRGRASLREKSVRVLAAGVHLAKEIGGTVYTVTGSYDGVETLDKKMERIMGEKFTEKMEDSE